MATLTAPSRKLSRLGGFQGAATAVHGRAFGGKLRIYLSIFRLLTLTLAVSQMGGVVPKASISISMVIVAASLYTVVKILTPVTSRKFVLSQALLVSDLIFCAVLVWFTGGVSSPFLLYTLSPVLAASFYFESKLAVSVAVASILDILLTQLVNPFYNLTSGPLEFSFFFIYIVAVSLAASLPYLVNLNLQQRMQGEFVAEERQRLSRELHDGTVQALTALNWQAQLVERDLSRMGVTLPSVAHLLQLSKESQSDAREALQLLRDYTESGKMLEHLKTYVQQVKQDGGIDYQLDLLPDEPKLEPHVELQLLRICQEALTNIRKHSRARHVVVGMVRAPKNYLTMTIEDDGLGFDLDFGLRTSGFQGHGLNVMRERADSVGGYMELNSELGKGTVISVVVPLNR